MTLVNRMSLAGLLAIITLFSGCGGGGGSTLAGIGGTGKTVSGTITGFGSIFVNDVEYDIGNATISINDDSSPTLSQADLRIGMVVTLTASDDGTVGTATRVIYDNEIKGPVSNLSTLSGGLKKTFTIFGMNAVVDVAATAFDDSSTPGFSFATLAEGDVVELSGLFDSTGTLIATYIEKTDDLVPGNTEVEVKGVPAPGTDAGVGESFVLDGVTVNITASTDLGDVPGGRVSDRLTVEVKGTLLGSDPARIDATRIKQEEKDIEAGDGEASIEGFISDFTDTGSFRVSGTRVDASGAKFEPAGLVLGNDLRVEVEGMLVNGILNAKKVELKD
ncbi:MAG TPA: hypothetical protein ENK49_02035 [Gammaproteobacteria bacterium]|nr:hypothetical protein [Gammaproteobacteria bacterium]